MPFKLSMNFFLREQIQCVLFPVRVYIFLLKSGTVGFKFCTMIMVNVT